MEPSERSTAFDVSESGCCTLAGITSARERVGPVRPLATPRFQPHACLMKPIRKLWPLVVALSTGLWAGVAAAQDDDGGWFEGSDSERPTLHIEGKGQYDPPPPDFQSDPSVDYSAPEDTGSSEAAPPAAPADAEEADGQQRAVVEFSPYLASYGYWVADPVYGRVWVPERRVVGAGFVPYSTAGHWELTPRDEWLWASDYPFGWVTFHYGRWVYISGGAWGWVPGYTYAPAWVDFRVGVNGYVGWGPLPPYSVWRGGVFVSIGARRPLPYVYCPTNYVFSHSVNRYVVRDRYRVRNLDAQSYRYRSARVSGVTRVHYPTPAEARISPRYLPRERVVARPRLSSAQLSGSRSRFRQADPSPRGAGRSPNYWRQDSGRQDGRQEYGRQDHGRQEYGRQDHGRQGMANREPSRAIPRSGWDARRDAAGPNPRPRAGRDGRDRRAAPDAPDNAWTNRRGPDSRMSPARPGPSRPQPQGSANRGAERRSDGRASRGASGGGGGGGHAAPRDRGRGDTRGNSR